MWAAAEISRADLYDPRVLSAARLEGSGRLCTLARRMSESVSVRIFPRAGLLENLSKTTKFFFGK